MLLMEDPRLQARMNSLAGTYTAALLHGQPIVAAQKHVLSLSRPKRVPHLDRQLNILCTLLTPSIAVAFPP